MKYTVYFELFGKKMKYETEADSEADAKRNVSEKLIFHKVVKQPRMPNTGNTFYDLINLFKRKL